MDPFSAYRIPNPAAVRAAPDRPGARDESEEARLKRLYLKSAAAAGGDESLAALSGVLSVVIDEAIANFQVDGRIPASMRESFERDM